MQRGTRALTGVGLAVGGALLGMLAITVLPWYRSSFGGILANGSTVSDIRTSISLYEHAPDVLGNAFSLGISPVFFGGLAFVLLLLAALAAFAGAGLNPGPARVAAIAGVVLAVGGLVLTAFAIRYVDVNGEALNTNPPGYGDFVSQSGLGAWAMVLGYLLIGVGAVLAAGSRDELRELLRDPDDDEIAVEAPVEAPVAPSVAEPADEPGAPVTDDTKDARRTDDVW